MNLLNNILIMKIIQRELVNIKTFFGIVLSCFLFNLSAQEVDSLENILNKEEPDTREATI